MKLFLFCECLLCTWIISLGISDPAHLYNFRACWGRWGLSLLIPVFDLLLWESLPWSLATPTHAKAGLNRSPSVFFILSKITSPSLTSAFSVNCRTLLSMLTLYHGFCITCHNLILPFAHPHLTLYPGILIGIHSQMESSVKPFLPREQWSMDS